MSREELLSNMVDIVGRTSLRVYIQVVEQYVRCYSPDMPEGEVWMKPNHKYIMKEENLKYAQYFKVLNSLTKLGYLDKKKVKGKLMWRPRYEALV